MIRGEIWHVEVTHSMGGEHPFLIVSDDSFCSLPWVTVLPITRELIDAPLFRVPILKSSGCGVILPSHTMVDQIGSMRRTRFKRHLGCLHPADMASVDRALMLYVGLAGSFDRKSVDQASAIKA